MFLKTPKIKNWTDQHQIQLDRVRYIQGICARQAGAMQSARFYGSARIRMKWLQELGKVEAEIARTPITQRAFVTPVNGFSLGVKELNGDASKQIRQEKERNMVRAFVASRRGAWFSAKEAEETLGISTKTIAEYLKIICQRNPRTKCYRR